MECLCSSPVYVEGDIETRVFNDSINGETKFIPEICVRYDGKFSVFCFSYCYDCNVMLWSVHLLQRLL